MELFLGGSLALVLGFGVYFFLMRRGQSLFSRFRVRLTLTFLGFTLLPVIPALFFIASLVTSSTDLLLLPGLENALRRSLDTIRIQSETRGVEFLDRHPDPGTWNSSLLKENGIDMAVTYRQAGKDVDLVSALGDRSSELSRHYRPAPGFWIEQDTANSDIVSLQQEQFLLMRAAVRDSLLTLIAYPLRPEVVQARDDIGTALQVYAALSIMKKTAIEKNLVWILALFLVYILALLAALAAGRIAAGINRPVQALVDGMQQVAAGDLTSRISEEARDEFGYLIDSFNTMTSDLDENRKKLLAAERLAAWQQVARQISHEIKNALTPISLSLRRLYRNLSPEQLPAPVKESLHSLEKEANSLSLLADEFSRFARLPKPQKSLLDLLGLCEDVRLLLQPAFPGTGITVRAEESPPGLRADPEQLKRVLINLVKNGLEASSPGDEVLILVRSGSPPRAGVEVEVRDKGSGMTPEVQERLFEPYLTTKKGGTGLGLAIVQKIVHEHGGTISVNSTPGKGTAIIVWLPRD